MNAHHLLALAPVIQQLRRNQAYFNEEVWEYFFDVEPLLKTEVSGSFPIAGFIAKVLEGADQFGALDEVSLFHLAKAKSFGLSYGFRHFRLLAAISKATMVKYCDELPRSVVIPAERAFDQAVIALETIEIENPTFPVNGEVVEVEKRCRNISVVRVLTEQQIPYTPGQHLPVSSSYTHGIWRDLWPSIPSNEAGQIEFHIYASGTTSTLLAGAKPGDIWRIGGVGEGNITVDPDEDLLIITHSTGLAAARAIILDIMMSGKTPMTHLYVSADYPGELYELVGLWQLASTSPWMFITPVVRHIEDAWWVRGTDHSKPPRGLHLTKIGEVGQVVAGFGTWHGHQIFVFGPDDMVRTTVRTLVKNGTPRNKIQYQGFTHPYFWE